MHVNQSGRAMSSSLSISKTETLIFIISFHHHGSRRPLFHRQPPPRRSPSLIVEFTMTTTIILVHFTSTLLHASEPCSSQYNHYLCTSHSNSTIILAHQQPHPFPPPRRTHDRFCITIFISTNTPQIYSEINHLHHRFAFTPCHHDQRPYTTPRHHINRPSCFH